MSSTNREIAAAFAGHRFDAALPFVTEDAEWVLVGEGTIAGAPAIAEACRSTVEELTDVATRFLRFEVVDGGDVVAVDSLGVYTAGDGEVSSVSSCDLFSFRDGRIIGIRSYTVEVEPGDDD